MYTNLLQSLLTSTVWLEDDETRIVWITMLAMANKRGEVLASIPGLARRAGVSVTECEKALDNFKSPDPYSRTPDHEGRRIMDIDGGWFLLNHGKFQKAYKDEKRKRKAAERQRRCRDRQKDCDGNRSERYLRRQESLRNINKPSLREEVFARSGNCCVYCGSRRELTVDHIVPVVRGGGDELDNLQVLCRSCNSAKGARLEHEIDIDQIARRPK